MKFFFLSMTSMLALLTNGCRGADNLEALVIGNANIERIYDVVGATEDDATVVRRRASPIAGGYRVVEEEVSRSSTSPKNGMPLGGVEYHLQVDPAKGIATKVQMGSRQILVKAPLIAQSEPWTNTVQVARQGGTDKATETCKISGARAIPVSGDKRLQVTTECVTKFDGTELVSTTDYVESVGMTRQIVQIKQGSTLSRALQIQLRGPY